MAGMTRPQRPPVAAAPDVAAYLAEVRGLVDRWLVEKVLPPEGRGAPRLAEALRYSLLAGGKRLRPALALAASRGLGGQDAAVLPWMGALECLHTYSLIHDDLPAMDDDALRRGKPTSHVVFGEALAILAGDALHTLAFETLLTHTPDPAVARDLGVLLARAAGHRGMVGGQVEDLAADGQPADAGRLARIHAGKTAALFAAACEGGARAAGAPPAACAALATFGLHLGLAFQIVDDVLDETGTPESLGKTPGKDRRAKKMTYVALEGVDAARARARAEADAALAAAAPHDRAGLLAAITRYVTARTG
jgi:geranylgeranyl pyrophosphate synthase